MTTVPDQIVISYNGGGGAGGGVPRISSTDYKLTRKIQTFE